MGGECCTAQRISTDQQLLDRVLGQASGIIAVDVAAGDPEQSLSDQVPDRMLDLARLPTVTDAGRQSLRQPQPLVARLQQNCPAVGAAVLLVELHHHRAAKQVGKQDRLSCGIFWHARALRVTETLVVKPFLSQQELLLPPFSRPFAHYLGVSLRAMLSVWVRHSVASGRVVQC